MQARVFVISDAMTSLLRRVLTIHVRNPVPLSFDNGSSKPLHRPWWKCWINAVLRRVQAGRRWRLVIRSIITDEEVPRLVGYDLGWVDHDFPS